MVKNRVSLSVKVRVKVRDMVIISDRAKMTLDIQVSRNFVM